MVRFRFVHVESVSGSHHRPNSMEVHFGNSTRTVLAKPDTVQRRFTTNQRGRPWQEGILAFLRVLLRTSSCPPPPLLAMNKKSSHPVGRPERGDEMAELSGQILFHLLLALTLRSNPICCSSRPRSWRSALPEGPLLEVTGV